MKNLGGMAMNRFGCENWQEFVPEPVFQDKPEYFEFYKKAWELAHDHIRHIEGMPQTPYMDEAFFDMLIWIWDTCFMSLFCKYARPVFPGVESLKNFYEVMYGKKRLAKIIPSEKETWGHLIRGVPNEIKLHSIDNPPLFAWAEYENALMSGDVEYLRELLYEHKFLQKHFERLENLREKAEIDGVLKENRLIAEKYGYKWEGGTSGMDNTPRGRIGEHATVPRPNNPNMLWIDAICQQALSAKMISNLFEKVGDKDNQDKWNDLFLDKKKIINELYWDSEDGFYYDIDCNTHEFYKVMSIASYWTMTARIATKEQADKLVKLLYDPKHFGGLVPFTTVSRSDSDYNPSGQYWRGSVWLPTAYATLKGLANYGYFKEAHELSIKLLDHMQKTYTDFEPHTIWECYSPTEYKPATWVNGERCVRPDFCGWSALGPISIYIEFILGFYEIDAFSRVVKWAKPDAIKGEFGIKNFRFGNIVTDICACGDKCRVKSNAEYTLEIKGTQYDVIEGINEFIVN